MTDIPLIERRRIEAQIVKPIHDVLTRELGRDKADALVRQAIVEAATAAGAAIAETRDDGTDLLAFADVVRTYWGQEGALEFTIRHSDAGRLDYDVTRCRYAEMYREMGLQDLGPILSCARDGTFCRGFDGRIAMDRTGTLMEGASHCDFRFRMVEEDG